MGGPGGKKVTSCHLYRAGQAMGNPNMDSTQRKGFHGGLPRFTTRWRHWKARSFKLSTSREMAGRLWSSCLTGWSSLGLVCECERRGVRRAAWQYDQILEFM